MEVSVLLEDGRKLDGVLYAPPSGPAGDPGRLVDRLNDDSESFVALDHGEESFLLSKQAMVWVRLAAAADDGTVEQGAQVHEVNLVLTNGDSLAGTLRFAMPPERCRLLDYLNSAPGFITLERERQQVLLNRRFIGRIKDPSRGG